MVFALVGVAPIAVATLGAQSIDWPQWRGAARSGISTETGLLRQWPASGPPRVWSASSLGGGYGSLSVSGDRIFVQGLSVNSIADNEEEWAVNLQVHVIHHSACGFHDDGRRGGGLGAFFVHGDEATHIWVAGAADGTSIWQRNILREFSGRNISWDISESPLVDGNHVIVTPGGRGAGIVALDKMTGRTVWVSKELSDEAGYASAIVADVGGVRTIMTLTGEAAVGVRATDGKLMWRYTPVANRTANITTPVYQDNKVFYSSAYGTGGALLALQAEGGEVRAKEVYFTRDLQNHHGGVVVVNGYLYGFSNSILTCLEFATGKMMWRHRSVGKGSLTYADGHLYLLSEDNVVGLAEASAAGYKELGRFPIADQGLPSWAHPVVSGGRLYIRNQSTLASYDVRAR